MIKRSVERILFIKLVEVLVTNLGGYLWNVTRSHLSELVPIEALKEWVSLDFIGAISAESGICVTDQSLQNVCRSWRKLSFSRNLKSLFPMHDLLAGYRGLIREERRITNKHLKKNASYTPPVNCFVIAVLSKHLWSDVIWCSNS